MTTKYLFFRGSAILALLFLLIAICATASFAATDTTLYGFNSMPNGAIPTGNLVRDSAGNFYGVTFGGGAWGTVFKLSLTKSGGWTETVIHNFTNSPDGAYPSGSLIFDSAGNLYGTTSGGGADGLGAIFKLTPNGKGWTETIIFNFSFATGWNPNSLIFDSKGNLYGATSEGGSGGCYNYEETNVGCGLVFELSPQSNGTWTEKVLYNFTFSQIDDAVPAGPLVFDKAGNLYGTAFGFCDNCGNSFVYPAGEIFELSPTADGAWTESVPYSFQNTNASNPGNLVIDSAGNLYGTTQYGGTSYGGTFFELSPPTTIGGTWTETVVYNFLGSNSGDGAQPSSLILDSAGNFYGTTQWGGSSASACLGYYSGCGTVFQVSPNGSGDWVESVLYKYTESTDGGDPVGIYRDASGNLYMNGDGGPECEGYQYIGGCGGVLKLSFTDSVWTPTVLYDFTFVVDGFEPYAGLVADSAGNFYGTTEYGGTYFRGTVFKVSKNSRGTWQDTILYSFGSIEDDAYAPMSTLILDSSGNLYGTTGYGGANGAGTVFELSPGSGATWTETIVHSFIDYGTTDGCGPTSSLVFDHEGNFYGTTGACGLNGGGTVFEMSPRAGGGWTESVIYNFGGSYMSVGGTSPTNGIAIDKNGNLYGATRWGGSSTEYYDGVVYELSPPVNSGGPWSETVLYAFPTSTAGNIPTGTVAIDEAGDVYGTTEYGGKYNAGIVFKLTPSGGTWTETNLYNFKGANGDGGTPVAGVALDSSGNLYGTTQVGGLFSNICQYGCGTAFKLTETSGKWEESVLHKFTGGSDGSIPVGSLILDSEGNIYSTASASGSGAAGTVFEIKQ